MLEIKTCFLLLLLVIPALGGEQSRTPFLQPFSSDSPWNTPIGDDAKYQAVEGIEEYYGGVNYNDRWTTGIQRATKQDTSARLYVYGPKMWSLLELKKVKTSGNPPELEEELRKASKPTTEFAANYYATSVKAPPGQRTWPKGIRDINVGWTNIIYMPKDARSSPDSDAHLAVFQPNNLVLECYGAVVCANGDVICAIAGFTDPRSDGTGTNNGRLASLLNNYAGIIRKGEVINGRISHCLNATCSRLLLTTKAIWPAYTFDTNDRYEGELPMGALLAIPPDININNLGLSKHGMVIARTAQDYGIYITDRGGDGGITIRAALDADDAMYEGRDNDATIIIRQLKWIVNNGPNSVGGGGKRRSYPTPPLEETARKK